MLVGKRIKIGSSFVLVRNEYHLKQCISELRKTFGVRFDG